ncbi:MAG: hypothetical protein TEF_10800 [Rhizobiales bacterium NRL2]|nr:MAG: hypothetical protein TEF_10800 [Rhizobiales bacterium NRL2]
MTDAANLDELIADLRRQDPDRLYIALFAPPALRERLIGLHAFNLEVAATRERVSEPMLGQIRLQWWRDALGEIRRGDEPRRHPVVQSLTAWMPAAGDTAFDLAMELVNARERDLEDAPFATVNDLSAYAEATSSNLVRLGLLAAGVTETAAHDAALAAGRAYALAGLVRAVPFHGAQGRVMLPVELLARHGIADARQSIGRRDPGKLKSVLTELAEIAERDLASARALRSLPKASRAPLLVLPLARLYLKRLRRARFDLSEPRIDPGNAARIAALWRARFLA